RSSGRTPRLTCTEWPFQEPCRNPALSVIQLLAKTCKFLEFGGGFLPLLVGLCPCLDLIALFSAFRRLSLVHSKLCSLLPCHFSFFLLCNGRDLFYYCPWHGLGEKAGCNSKHK
uniref:Uncharacterized protein n=1 Tax=Varanus komodoensis TaxID=61221 RepID=A0A8D2L0A6_VARKO